MAKLLAHLDTLIHEAAEQVKRSRKDGGPGHKAEVRLLHGLEQLHAAGIAEKRRVSLGSRSWIHPVSSFAV